MSWAEKASDVFVDNGGSCNIIPRRWKELHTKSASGVYGLESTATTEGESILCVNNGSKVYGLESCVRGLVCGVLVLR